MRFLVTAGNTLTPIDRVRGITNIFTGRTGARIASAAHAAGHDVTLLTSQPADVPWRVESYRTYDDLAGLLHRHVAGGRFDVIIHVAAVSDYQSAGVYRWPAGTAKPEPIDASGKVKSTEPEVWLRLTPTLKLVDQFRSAWGFAGVLVKFKLEVGVSDDRLLEIAEASRRHSDADLMVANTLEGMATTAFLGPIDGAYQRVARDELPGRLLGAIAQCRRPHG